MKKICFYIDTLQVGGIEKVLIELLKNINKEKYKVTLLIGHNLQELEKLKELVPNDIKIDYILEDNIFCKYKKKKALGTLNKVEKIFNESISWIKKIIIVKRLMNELKDKDIVIDFDMTLAPYVKKLNKKIITYCHFSPKNYNRGIKRRQIKLGKRLNNYNRIIVISDDMKKEAVEMYPFLENKITRIYNSFDVNKLEMISLEQEEINSNLLNKKYIISVGRLEETQKDFITLIKAFSLVEKEIEEELYIIGEGRHKERLQNLVKELNIENRVKFLGFKKNPYPWIRNASLFVHSSKFEGLPTVVIEALILKKLIICTDCPTGPREILDDGKNGILTRIGNEKELAEAIKNMLVFKTKNQYYLENLNNKIQEFDCRNVIKQLENIIDTL